MCALVCTCWGGRTPTRSLLTDCLAHYYSPTRFAGPGHTSVLYTNPLNRKHIDHFGSIIKTVRVLINTPASQVCARACVCVGGGGAPYGTCPDADAAAFFLFHTRLF